MDKRILSWFIPLALLYIGVLFVPDHIERYALIYQQVSEGEYLRFLSFQFSHLDVGHLMQNLLGLGIICMLLRELHLEPEDVFSVYLLTGIFAVLPLWFFTHSTLLGASSAVYGGFGIALLGSLKLKAKTSIFFLGMTLPMIIQLIEQGMQAWLQIAFHLSGFIGGVLLYLIWTYGKAHLYTHQRKILEQAQ